MDDGPGTDLGALGWFLGVWIVMMAAMMFPSVSPTVALYARMAGAGARCAARVRRRLPRDLGAGGPALLRPLRPRTRPAGDELTWAGAGRWLAGGTLVIAALYQLTPMKDACLAKCRSPFGFLLGSWRDGRWAPSAWARATARGAWAAAGP